MATIDDYLDIAQIAYSNQPDSGLTPPPHPFRIVQNKVATWYGTGFQGVVCRSENEVIIAFSGTKGSWNAPISQNGANFRIMLKIIPNMAGNAYKLVRAHMGTGRKVSLVGHSLGGALAQVVGTWLGLPFISFNGPGMATALRVSKANVFHPKQMLRAHLRSDSSVAGICFVVQGDRVGEYGTHVGTLVTLTRANQNETTHDLRTIRGALRQLVHERPTRWEPSFGIPAPPQGPPTLAVNIDAGPNLPQF